MVFEKQQNMEIPPTEDLMREHGVLKRILLIYQDVIECLNGMKPCNPSSIKNVVYNTATIAQSFIENYHQRLEENYVFPVFFQRGQYVELVRVLQEQHNAARHLTNLVLKFSSTQISCGQKRFHLAYLLSLYIRMYEPHSAREDTVLFPSFRKLLTPGEFEQLGKLFEEIEEQKFGTNGFQRIVNQVAEIEQMLGIYDLSQFTPKLY
ncbi:MAG: hypothetical protein A4E53_02535 [Pelotomaculum sp. PtaB.Bin104]|nr:MAG: hypothetical protein A4E53_02535 [Pelotomaculum sp. PtaB.Bin104]